ncbi:hypothetical protein [Novosphingobium sp.]|uniref:hypothetical protein n=1 Tax=Novosphingobium sp. TaxID=1874826 RepID=UPI0031DFED4E
MTRSPRMIAALAAGLLPSAAFAAACPGRSFEAFLTAFGRSAQVQRAHVADPLLSGSIDADAEPEPRMVKRKVSAASLAFPVMPLEARRRHDGLAMSKAARSGGAVEVLLAKPDTGYQLRYLFRPTASCWTLTEMADESM